MDLKHGWLIVLVIVALLVAACGPEMTTPTPRETEAAGEPATAMPSAEVATEGPTVESLSYAGSVDAEDWHVLGSPDALLTMVEYSEFQ